MTRALLFLAACVTVVGCHDALEPVPLARIAGPQVLAQAGVSVTDLGGLGSPWSQANRINGAGLIVGHSGDRAFVWQSGAVTDIGTLGGQSTFATALSEQGHVVGSSATEQMTDSGVVNGPHHAFLWQNGVMTDLDPQGLHSMANGVNSLGQVIGFRFTEADGTRAILWANGSMTDLGSLGGQWSGAFAINDAGQIVGSSSLPPVMGDTGLMAGETHAFLWQNGQMIDLGALGGDFSQAYLINASGQVVGVAGMSNGFQRAFIWQNGVMTDLGTLGGRWSWASDINDAGQIVGQSETASGEAHAFLWDNGTMIDLGALSGTQSWAQAINDAGQIVGAAAAADSMPRAFLWENGAMIDLGANGGTAAEALSLNNNGQVVGYNVFDFSSGQALLWTLADKASKPDKIKKPKTK